MYTCTPHNFNQRSFHDDDFVAQMFDAPNGQIYWFCEHSVYCYDHKEGHMEFLNYHWLKNPTAETVWELMMERHWVPAIAAGVSSVKAMCAAQ